MHFVGISAAREAAGVGGPPRKIGVKTGPRPGSIVGERTRKWSRERVIDELRRLHLQGKRTAYQDLVRLGHADLVHAAATYVGGLRRARELARIEGPPRRRMKAWWTEARIVDAIRSRYDDGLPLSFTKAPARLVTAGVWHFGSWRAALEATGIDPDSVRLPHPTKSTRQSIIERLRREARAGSDLRASTLAKAMKLEAVRREFGTLRDAIIAAGLGDHLQRRKHGRQKWSRQRVIEVLQQRAKAGDYKLTPGLYRVTQLYFGGAEAARSAAGVPSPVDRVRRKRSSTGLQPRPRLSTGKRRLRY